MATAERPVAEQKPQKSWFGRNWWWVLLLVIVGGGLICCGVCGGVLYYVFSQLRESEPYKMTLEMLAKDPVVIEKLGEPITDTPVVSGSVHTSNGDGEAKLLFPINGPKGAAQVTSEARRAGGKWSLTYVEVDFGGGNKHILEIKADTSGGGLGDAPPWRPPGEVGPEGMPGGTQP